MGKKRGKRGHLVTKLGLWVVGRQLRHLGHRGGELPGREGSSRGVDSGERGRGPRVYCIDRYGGGGLAEGRGGSVVVSESLI